jgi:hypothetical protein
MIHLMWTLVRRDMTITNYKKWFSVFVQESELYIEK